ncbi:MAG: 3-oxoacyl-[acyl-carrier-protein] synthase III C-terminal domain-containing protein [Fusobacteriaceae bacterium]
MDYLCRKSCKKIKIEKTRFVGIRKTVFSRAKKWIVERTGIKERYIANHDEKASDLGLKAVQNLLSKNIVKKEDIDLFVPHQANVRIIDGISKKLKVSKKLFYSNVDRYGNTSSASIGIALDEITTENKIELGTKLALFSFGAGLSSGVLLFEYNEKI